MDKVFRKRECKFPNCEEVFTPRAPKELYCGPTHEVSCVLCETIFATKSGSSRKELCRKCTYAQAHERRKATIREHHGVENQFQRPEIKAQLKESWKKTYGGHPTQNETVKQKIRETNLERYGGVAPASSDEVLKKIRETNLEKYGVEWTVQDENTKKKIEKTNLERYGAKTPLESPEVQAKVRETNIERYGVENQFSREAIQEKIRKTLKERYGAEHPLQSEEIREKLFATNQEKFGTDWPFGNKEVMGKVEATMMELYGVRKALNHEEFLKKAMESYEKTVAAGGGRSSRISKLNRRWKSLIEDSFGVAVTYEKRFGEFSADLYVESANLLIDINPTITHNTLVSLACLKFGCEEGCSIHRPKPADYHLKRAKSAQMQNSKLIQIYDWDGEEQVLRLLSGHLERGFQKHSARKLSLKELSPREANDFLNREHIQGGLKKQLSCFGLFDDRRLLAVATFGASRFGSPAQWEFLRYAVRKEHLIHGGAGKLWNAFIAKENPESVVSYLDFNHTVKKQTFLNSLGFREENRYSPTLNWSKGRAMLRETSLLKLGADRLLKTNYGSRERSAMDNHQIMILEGWLPVHTAGNRTFIWTR